MNTEEIKMIGEIDFRDIKVKVYHNKDKKDKLNISGAVWQMRNPDSCYQGLGYIDNETGKCSYPVDAVIPEQTDKDREIIPKFIIIEKPDLNDELVKSILIYLETEYLKRNNIKS